MVHWPNFNPEYPVPAAPGVIPPSSPFVSIAPTTGRLPRTFQWSIGFQQEITSNLVVDAAYVGNRGAWWAAPLLAGLNYNALTPQQLLADGINVTNKADTTLLNTQINSPAVIARFPYLANPNNVYPGFPATQTLLQALRPYPQWNGIPPFLGPPDGNTWYDSLQVKVTKRFSHGLSGQVAYTWQKELTNGTNSNTSYVTPSPPLINDVFNKALDKQISGFDIPQELIIAFNYTTPKRRLGFRREGRCCPGWQGIGLSAECSAIRAGNCCKVRSRPTIFLRTWAGGRGTTPPCGAAVTRLWTGCRDSRCSW